MSSRTASRRLQSLALFIIALPLALLWLLPLWMMLVSATLPEAQILSSGFNLWPSTALMDNLQTLQAATNFTNSMWISFVVATTYTILSATLTSMAGWALVRYEFYGKRAVLGIILGTITLPYLSVVIPQFILVARDLKLSNTWFALIVPPLFNSIGVLFMRQTFSMLPGELFDAARVEGVKEWKIFTFVALPLVRPSLAALGIILFLSSWNNYLWPLLINSRPEMSTAPVALSTLIGVTRVSWGGIMTGTAMLTVPMVVIFLLLQRHFIAGIAAGAVK